MFGLKQFSTGAYKQSICNNKAAGRVDFNSARFGTSPIHFFNEPCNFDNPYGNSLLPLNGGC
jgi:hypothetical protein